MMTLLFINLLTTIIFISLTHPLSMGLILLIQTLTISLITGNFNYNFWFSYIIFLILVGGMLILFMYMTSVASNEKFSFNIKYIIPMMTATTIMLMSSIKLNINTINNEMLNLEKNMTINYSLVKYINFPNNLMLTFLIMYLLLTLIATVKITGFKQGPMRLMN